MSDKREPREPDAPREPGEPIEPSAPGAPREPREPDAPREPSESREPGVPREPRLHRIEVPGPVPESARTPADQTSLPFQPEKQAHEPPDEDAPGVRLEIDAANIAWVVFDDPDSKINTLSGRVLETLRRMIDQALRRNVGGLVFVSDKPKMFLAGADIDEIAQITDVRDGTKKAAYGQAVFEAVALFPRPTAAVITGPCLGGGYELALACTYRIAENSPSVKIGLPEIKIGAIPGFGGTQRLPQRVGLPTALDLILAGKTLPAKPAFKRGMVDALVPEGRGREIAAEVVGGKRRLSPRRPGRTDRLMASVGPLRDMAFRKARESLEKKVARVDYPAPYLALEAVAAGLTESEVEGYATEARLLGEAAASPTAKNLLWLFRRSGDAKHPEGLPLDTAPRSKRLAVVGAGIMGGGIAWLAGEKGVPIRVKDIQLNALEGALAAAGKLWSRNVKRRRITKAQRDRRLESLSFTLDYRGFRHVDFVIEAVVEDLGIKHQVFEEIEREVDETAVLASNTSSLRIEDIASKARHPERIVGLHFFNPVDRMPLVEVVRGPKSSTKAVATAYRLALDLGKTPILVRDCPGFLVNRILAFYLGEALHLFENGADPVRVDRVLKRFGMPMGPFALLDQIGLDVADKVTKVVKEAYGDRLPTQSVVNRLAAEGHLGKKSGRGFYVYDEAGKVRSPAPEASAAAGTPTPKMVGEEEITDRLLLAMVNEAARCLDEGIVARPLDVDLGMVMGTGFPPFRGGLLRWADARGVGTAIKRLEALAVAEPRLAPSDALRRRSEGFYADASSVD